MIKEISNILKKYYKMIDKDKHLLIPYYAFYCLTIIVDIFIPLVIANITESITSSLYLYCFSLIFTLLILELTHTLFRYLDMRFYSSFFKHNYLTLYKRVVSKLFSSDQNYQDKISNGRILNSLTIDIVNIGEMADYFLNIFLNSIKYIIILIYLFKVNLIIGLFIFITNIFYMYLGNTYTKEASIHYIKQRNANDSLLGLINQSIKGLKDIKANDLSKKLNRKYNSIYKEWYQAYTNKRSFQIKRIVNISAINTVCKSIVYIFCLLSIMNNSLSLSHMLIIISYFTMMHTSIDLILEANSNIKEENISLNRLSELLEIEEIANGEVELTNCQGKLEFSNVTFSYKDQKTIKKVNFILEENKINAIVGHNGAGKTTLVNLMLKLNNPDKGFIYLDGIDISTISKESYLKNVSILNQDTYLFNLSIRENFNLITKDSKKQESICKLLRIDSWIKKLPKGYDTIINEDSTNISGGEKRLLSLARTLLRDSKIIIFDEITSSLDLTATNQIIDILNKLKEDHTIILITHKRELMSIADKIIVLDNGRVSGEGKHSSLLKTNKVYKNMYQSKK